ncbi:molybdopterin-dependent oxidoreductase [Paraburkholderia tropica]|uniref:DMSO/TMAO reductase YedYZ, molybdopterin-dependent catalytic subunit n=1 Tax=Paraburkholderia tropica TaxID=92647 RepID=A0A1A5X6B0_9BURK|nr:molybdopterin-dependent oxidoreductase [Paraburkholderia tropica]MBB2979727.1 DMSO/TMAO reductase YedYZ molybdopterin-dependent catalytic subunit [Paraburkholderia tropica]OBR49091.1 molybdopterin-binding protein [Paraburkholderia tropica]QNB15758.1 molybdopterin-dependent oxidoreductase [Paraburkholderia tropica]RQN39450.1 molybdopterin-binding protein [Paraburkholderia tropica]SEJ67209.1 DMSO/TMAO reductase YedYZ, molybdopterin-dependent catalytic subunit [Paraburkholderia tropica]
MTSRKTVRQLDGASIIKDARKALPSSSRRLFGKRILTLGGLALLSGCDLKSEESVNTLLRRMSSFNDRVQAVMFNPNTLAPTYPESMITRPFPFNAYYDIDEVPEVDRQTYRLEVSGLAKGKRIWSLDELHAMPQQSQITRHICIEGWSAIGQWGGVRFSDFLLRAGVDTTAKYVALHCADNYWTSIDMPTALHPQTLLTLTYGGATLPAKYGFPLKLRIPTKLGYKNPKHIVAITVGNEFPGGYWENQGYNWFGGS